MAKQERHKLQFFGSKRLNWKRRKAEMDSFLTDDGTEASVRMGRVEGLRFGYMVAPGIELWVFSVDTLLLKRAVRVDWDRVLPDGRGPAPNGKRLGEAAARALLNDVMEVNASQRAELESRLAKLRDDS